MSMLKGRHIKLFHSLVLGLLLAGIVSASAHQLVHLLHEQAPQSPVAHQNTRQDTIRDDCMACTLLSSIAFDRVDTEFQPLETSLILVPPSEYVHLDTPRPRIFGARAPPVV